LPEHSAGETADYWKEEDMVRSGRWFQTVAVLLLGAMLMVGVTSAEAERLPVFKLKEAQVDKVKARELFGRGLGAAPTEQERPEVVTYHSGRKLLEVDRRSGHMFMGDMEKLWNPQARANVPDEARARQTADRFLQENQLLPSHADQRVRAVFSHYSETGVGQDAPGQVNKQILDRQVNYQFEVTVKDPSGQERQIPVYGGGGKLKVAVGDQGRVVGFAGGWREIDRVEAEVDALPQAAAEARFRSGFGTAQLRNVKSRLAYWAAPAFEEQTILAPVWVVSGEVQVGQEFVPAREVVIPATQYGPVMESGPQQAPRTGREPAPDSAGYRHWLDIPGILHDLVAPPVYAQVRRCGTSWIGTSQGLSGSWGNKQGFVNQCQAAGWNVAFDWGDTNAWESDWAANDDLYIDNVDLVFYTGHASPNGWSIYPPHASSVASSKMNVATIDWWGNNRLRWLIVAACGPHQSTHFTTNTTNAFDRWRNVFDGMNIFLGYGAVTYDNTSEGRRFMELARAGWGVIDAWFRTAWEIQPTNNTYSAPNGPKIWVTAMYAHNGNHCQRNERLYGMGPTCPSVVGAGQQRHFLWSGT
jgi:hypothetical protein